jgi:hypothetical protein
VYYGNIDKTEIDEISLDLYALYGTSDVAAMEEKAIDFTRRIITKRLEVFCGNSAEIFFANYKSDDLWQSLFYATMANPRNLRSATPVDRDEIIHVLRAFEAAGLGVMNSLRSFRSGRLYCILLTYNLDQHPLLTPTIKFSIKNLLPWPKVQLTTCDRKTKLRRLGKLTT